MHAAPEHTSLTVLKGIGPALEEKLGRLGLRSVEDVLFHLPLRYQDRTRIMPISARHADSIIEDDGDEETLKRRRLTMQEKAIYLEGDALQIEMGNIVMRSGAGGTVLYDVARPSQHKDRYSALAMAVRYISE